MSEFDQFWTAYPRKVGKGMARKAFERARLKTTIGTILHALTWQVSQTKWVKDGGDYIPNPTTWLNQERWDDEPITTPNVRAKTLTSMKAIYEDDDGDE